MCPVFLSSKKARVVLVTTLAIGVAIVGLCESVTAVRAQTKQLVQVGHFVTGFDDLGNPLLIPSIDPAGISFHAPSGHLFVADSEINEVAAVWGVVHANIFEVSTAGDVLYNSYDTTTEGNNEPTDITYNEFDGHFYVSNDDTRKVYRYSYDEISGFTIVGEVVTTGAGATDPEGITSDPGTGKLYVVDGTAEIVVVYHYDEGGSAFVLDGVLDLLALNGAANTPNDPEGIAFHVPSGHLFLVSDPDQAVYEFTTAGLFVAKYPLGAFTPVPVAPQGLAFGPTSDTGDDPSDLSLYIADGGIDNDPDPNERDGAVYEARIVGEGITNERPVIDPIANQTVDEGVEVTFTVTATDPDDPPDNLTFSVVSSAPDGVSIDPITGLFSWIPGEEYGAGVRTIVVIVTDDGLPPLSDSTSVTITIHEVNQPPVLDPIGNRTTDALTELAFVATASDPDLSPGSDPELAEGLIAYWSFDTDLSSSTGSHSGTAVNGAVITNASGGFKLGGGALDLDGVDDYVSFGDISLPGDITLSAWLDPENIGSTTSSSAVVFGDNDNADWTRIELEAVRIKWNNVTVVMTSEPDFANGSWQHFVLVRSGGTVTVYRNGVVVATGTNDQPFTPEFLGWKNSGGHYGGRMDEVGVWGRALSPSEIAALYNDGTGLALGENTPQPANTLTFSLTGMVPLGAVIDPVTGAFAWTPTEEQAPDVYAFGVRVTDDGSPSLYDEETITVTVNERALSLDPIDDKTINEKETLSFFATLADKGPGSLTEELIAYWTFDENFEDNVGGHGGSGAGDAAITTSESKLGGGALTLDGVGDYVNVGDIPLAGDFSLSLWVKPEAIQSGTAGPMSGVLLGDGANADWLRLQLEGITAKWNNVTTSLTTEPDFVNGPWQHFVLVRSGSAITAYRDGVVVATGTKTEVFTPEFIGYKTPNDNFYKGLMDDLAVWTRALTPDEVAALYNGGNGLPIPVAVATFSLDGTVPEGAEIDPESGRFTWTPTELQGPGVYDFVVRATDTVVPSLFDTEAFSVTVLDVNEAPQLDLIAAKTVAEGDELTFTPTVTDADFPTNTLTFSLDAAPAGATIDPVTGVFTWTPTEVQGPGDWVLGVRVTDNGVPPLFDEQLVTVTVTEVNEPPVLAPVGDKTVDGGAELVFTASASDPDLAPALYEGLLAYWPFDSDFSSGTDSHDGTPINGALITNNPVEAKLGGGALKLDGVNDYMSFGDIALPADFSVSVWFYPQNIALGAASGAVVLGDGNNADWLRVESDRVQAKWNNVTTGFLTDPDFANGYWQHLVLVRNSGLVTVYRDGSVVATGTKTDVFTPEYVGWKNSGIWFNGMLDDMGLWGRALSGEEVASLYNGGVGAPVGDYGTVPANQIAFSLEGDVPSGAVIDPISGVFSWTPTGDQIPGSYAFDVVVTDDGTPPLSDRETITVTVIQVDSTAPTMQAIVEAQHQCYNHAPKFSVFTFRDDLGLDTAEYQIDESDWEWIFPSWPDTIWTSANWELPGFGDLDQGEHTVHFRVKDDAGNYNAGALSWSFVKDTVAPAAPTSFVALPGHNKVHLSWTNPSDPSFAGVEIRRVAWGDYADYATEAPEYPATHTAGDSVTTTSAEMCDDDVIPRDIYYYAAFAYDCAGNYSAAPTTAQDRSTNYWLGDIDPELTGDGDADLVDLSLFAGLFGTFDGGDGWNKEADFGPTDDWSRFGIPMPDNVVDFEDLMIFAMNYMTVSPSGTSGSLNAVASGAALRDRVTFRLVPVSREGEKTTYAVVIENASEALKGFSLKLAYGAGTSLESVTASRELTRKGSECFFGLIEREIGVAEICVAALGANATFAYEGELARVVARERTVGSVALRTVDLRDMNNGRDEVALPGGGGETPYIPATTALLQNHPNPFNPTTTIRFDLAVAGDVRIEIFDVSGALVRTLVSGNRGVGRHTAIWDGRDGNGSQVHTGVYFYRLTAEGKTLTKKMLLLK